VLAAGSLVTVFGGSGFIGRHTVRLLARRGMRVRAAERRPDLAGHLQPMGGPGQIMPVQANLRDAESVRRAVEGADAVVNLVAIVAQSGRQTFAALHVEGARRVAGAAREAGAKALVHVSAIGASSKSPSRYAKSKASGESAVLDEYPTAIILRPSIVFGPEDAFFNRFAAIAQFAPVMPVIGARTRFQPVYVGDVAEAIVAALDGKGTPGAVYELGGPEVLTMQALMDRTMAYAGHERPKVKVPSWLAMLGAGLSKPLPLALRPITVDQVRMLRLDNVVSRTASDEGRTLAGLGIAAPTAIETMVPAYLERFNAKGQFAHYRG
jgi:NADH dehydrogenase